MEKFKQFITTVHKKFVAIPKKKQISIFLFAFILLGIMLYSKAKPYYDFLSKKLKVSPTKAVLGTYDIKHDKEQINILILGIAGRADHEGTNLSDSISIVSYNKETNKIVTLGVPRDIWSEALRDKINSAYAYGEAKQPGTGGMKMAKIEIGATLGIPIHYVAVVSFQEFEELIDFVGGLEIDVKKGFTDKKYPIKGKEDDPCVGEPDYSCRYTVVSFKEGVQQMDGETALQFVRSRNSEGSEGNDFSRNSRQQQVMMALKERIIEIISSRDIKKISGLYDYINQLVRRDITNEEAIALARHVAMNKDFEHISAQLPMGLFEVPPYANYDGKYVLIPKDNNKTKLKTYIKCILSQKEDYVCKEVKAIVNKNTEELLNQ